MSKFLTLYDRLNERINNRSYFRGTWERLKTLQDRMIPFQVKGGSLSVIHVLNGTETDITGRLIVTQHTDYYTYNGTSFSDYLPEGNCYFKINGKYSDDVQVLPVSPWVDLDGNEYTTVIIGTQEWIVENWRCTKFADGTAIDYLTADAAWGSNTTGAYCAFGNNTTNVTPYGYLYNFHALANAKGFINLQREGIETLNEWRTPTTADWTTLIAYLGGDSVAGGALKETGTTYWQTPNTGATNSSGFTARPGEFRFPGASGFPAASSQGHFWSGNYNSANANYVFLDYQYAIISQDFNTKTAGYSVRAVRNVVSENIKDNIKISVTSDVDFGGTYYKGGFTQVLWKEGTVERGQGSAIEVIGDERNGVIVKERIITATKYRVRLKVTEPEYTAMVEALPGAWTITENGKDYTCNNLEISDPEWYQGNGMVTLTFTDNISVYAQNNTDL